MFIKNLRLISSFSLALILASCATLSSSVSNTPQHFTLNGALAVNTSKQNITANYTWLQNNDAYQIILTGPLGVSQARITGDQHHVQLQTSKNQIYSATTPEGLLQQQLGWSIPIQSLRFWIQGLADPNFPAEFAYDKNRLPIGLAQNGFQMIWKRNAQKHIELLIVQYPNLQIRMSIH